MKIIELDQLNRLVSQKLTIKQIAMELHRSPSTVVASLREYNIQTLCKKPCGRVAKLKPKRKCFSCDAMLNRGARTYCSQSCKGKGIRSAYLDRWRSGLENGVSGKQGGINFILRQYVLRKFNHRCVLCGWGEVSPSTGNIPVHIDHIDGNWQNNTEENLRVLCPNCHSLTPTFGSLNKGKGRPYRRPDSV